MRAGRRWFKYDKVTRQMVRVDYEPERRSVAPFVQGDEIPPTESMATQDRQIFTSKRKLLQHYKDHGYECTYGEIPGTKVKPLTTADKEERRADIREDAERSYYDLKYDRIPVDEKQRQIWKEEERHYQNYARRMRGR